jgi:hypothetical protein
MLSKDEIKSCSTEFTAKDVLRIIVGTPVFVGYVKTIIDGLLLLGFGLV